MHAGRVLRKHKLQKILDVEEIVELRVRRPGAMSLGNFRMSLRNFKKLRDEPPVSCRRRCTDTDTKNGSCR